MPSLGPSRLLDRPRSRLPTFRKATDSVSSFFPFHLDQRNGPSWNYSVLLGIPFSQPCTLIDCNPPLFSLIINRIIVVFGFEKALELENQARIEKIRRAIALWIGEMNLTRLTMLSGFFLTSCSRKCSAFQPMAFKEASIALSRDMFFASLLSQ